MVVGRLYESEYVPVEIVKNRIWNAYRLAYAANKVIHHIKTYAAQIHFNILDSLPKVLHLELRLLVSALVAIKLQPKLDKSLFFFGKPLNRRWGVGDERNGTQRDQNCKQTLKNRQPPPTTISLDP